MTDKTDKVTHHNSWQKDLQASEIRYRRLFESARDGILILDDASRKITDANPFMVEFLGYSHDEFLGKELWEIGLFKDKDESQKAFRELQEKGYIRYEDMPLQTKAGKQWNVEFISNVYRENGNLVIQCNIRDITARKLAEEALAQANKRVADILESITDAFFAVDHEWRFTYLNRQAEPLLQRSRDEILGKSIWEEFPEAVNSVFAVGSLFYEQYRRAAAEQVTVNFEEFFPPLNSWFEIHVYPGADGLSVYFHDITARKLAEEEREQLLARAQAAQVIAEKANQLKDEFLATLSHELRTPLTVIVGWAELLGNPKLDPVISLRAVEVIRRSARMQVQMIDDLLDHSRIITGKLRVSVQPVDLGTIIIAAVDGLRPAAEAKEIRLQLQLDSPVGQVSGDPDRLQQVAWNLISNAIKFTPRGGRVLVRLERVESHVEVTVSDTGQGIAPDFLPHVFERFRQADSTTTRVFGGLGLGLAIVRQLVELHGGTVRVDSEGEGLGSTFTFSLPLLAVRSAVSDTGSAQQPEFKSPEFECPPELNGLRVLIVDDEADTCELLQVIIEGCGAHVKTATSAAAALEAMAEEAFDVLISDIGMPEEDGYSLIAKVRALSEERGGKVPAAALTAYAGEEDRIRVLRSGFQIHVPKPVSPSELVAVVANLAERTGQG